MKLESVNPSVKVISTLICVVILSFQYSPIVNGGVFLVSLALLALCPTADLRRLGRLLLPALVTAFGLFVTGLFHGRGTEELSSISSLPFAVRAAMSGNFRGALQLSTRLLAYAGLGLLFTLTTDGEAFLSSLIHQCRLPPKFAYGILAAIHLIPNLAREYKAVRLAFQVRGMVLHPFSLRPIFTMLVNAIRWSESVAMAMESKGFYGDGPRTYYTVPKVHGYDWLYGTAWVAAVGIATAICM